MQTNNSRCRSTLWEVARIALRSGNTATRAIFFISTVFLVANGYAAKDYGYIIASGGPEDGGIFINGKYLGPASAYNGSGYDGPHKYKAPLGEIEIAIRDARYEEFITRAEVKPGKTVHIHYNLKRKEPAR